jgi:hypothetical protein
MMYETAKDAEFAKKIHWLFRRAKRTRRSWRFNLFSRRRQVSYCFN